MRRPRHRYLPGNNWCICAICGWKFRASEVRYNSDGFLVCSADYEPEHPLDKNVYAKKEKIVPDKVSPEPEEVYIDVGSTETFPGTFPWYFGG